ncbi:MAG: 3,4-dihydroxy-2-butanone-4-phosphate synthase [Gammaproteobacteria bacterium]|nr:3,4-dihydroxy-2-butanone-4-phosphate synthase [Gammaproteobacteria bacterium]
MELNTISEIIEDIRLGKMVILMDDEDRENEGDLIMAASMIRPEDINFMARYGRGLICLTLTRERCQQLQLPLMVANNREAQGTNFTVSIEASQGVTTGISAYDRAITVRAAVAPNASPADIVQPGHIFPLMAQPGGVLTRAGHTEAGCDLARLADHEPAGVIVEILNEDGTMARRPDLERFAQEHNLKIGTVADLIHHRLQNEPTIERVAACAMPTHHGDFQMFTYRDLIHRRLHYALTKGEVADGEPVAVRVHMQDSLCDLFDSRQGECHWPLRHALDYVEAAGRGVVIILNQDEENDTLLKRIKSYEEGAAAVTTEASGDLRTYGIGAQILIDLGVNKMVVLGTPKKLHAISGYDLEVTAYIDPETLNP